MAAAEEDAADGRNVREATLKGTVRPLAESISVEQAERASKQVQEAISQQQRQLAELQRFSDENKCLSELVLELPDSVSHRIMVLLGENHYAERSAKQTVEILERRSDFLDQKIAGAKAQIADLEAESSFVINTAEEAKAGLVEIREEYQGSGQLQLNQSSTSSITAAGSHVVSGSNLESTKSGSGSAGADEDREHDLLMARLSELELAEAAAGEEEEGSDEEVNEDSNAGVFEPFRSNPRKSAVFRNQNHLLEEEYDRQELEEEEGQLDNSDDEEYDVEDSHRSFEEEINAEDGDEDKHGTWNLGESQIPGSLGGRPLSRFAREVYAKKGTLDSRPTSQQRVTFQQGSPSENNPQSAANRKIYSTTLERPEDTQGFNDSQEERPEWRRQGAYQTETLAEENEKRGSSVSDHDRVPSLGEPAGAQRKAFTGIITEHSSPEPATSNEPQVQEAQQSRPISKFKMRQAQGGRR